MLNIWVVFGIYALIAFMTFKNKRLQLYICSKLKYYSSTMVFSGVQWNDITEITLKSYLMINNK